MLLPGRSRQRLTDQPALPLDVGGALPAPPREPRHHPRSRRASPLQLALELTPAEGAAEGGEETEEPPAAGAPLVAREQGPPMAGQPSAEPAELALDPPEFEPDPFAEIPGFTPAAQEFVLLPGSLRSRLDLRELTRFLAALPTVARDWEGAPELEDGGLRLRGPDGGAWIYPEPNRIRLVTDGAVTGPVAEDLISVCRWAASHVGMQLYPAGDALGAGADRSLDPGEVFPAR